MLILCSCTLHQKKVKDNNCNRVQSTQAGISETFQFKGIKLQTCSYLYILKSFHVLPNMIGQLPFVLAKKLKPCACGASRAKLWTRRQSQVASGVSLKPLSRTITWMWTTTIASACGQWFKPGGINALFLKEVLVAWWHGVEKNNTPNLSIGVCVKT